MGLKLRNVLQNSLCKKTQKAKKNYKLFKKVGLDKIKYINSYSANSISEFTDVQFQEIIDYDISLKKLSSEADHVTKIFEMARSEKILPKENPSSSADLKDYIKMLTGSLDDKTDNWDILYENLVRIEKVKINKIKKSFRIQLNDDVYFDKKVDHDSAPHLMKEMNDDNDCSHNNDSEKKMPNESDNSDDNRYDGYSEYNEYGEYNKGYYYCDRRYERRGSLMMSPIIFSVTA